MLIPYILSAITAATLWVDRNQTLQIKDYPNLHEINVILGKHPTDKRINIYFGICIALAIATPFVLPANFAIGVLAAEAALQAGVIYHNTKNKLKIKFW